MVVAAEGGGAGYGHVGIEGCADTECVSAVPVASAASALQRGGSTEPPALTLTPAALTTPPRRASPECRRLTLITWKSRSSLKRANLSAMLPALVFLPRPFAGLRQTPPLPLAEPAPSSASPRPCPDSQPASPPQPRLHDGRPVCPIMACDAARGMARGMLGVVVPMSAG